MQWLSRTIAIVVVMVVPGVLGSWLDARWGTQFAQPIGFGLGMLVATTCLVVLAQKLIPKAQGTPLPLEPDDLDEEDEDEKDRGI